MRANKLRELLKADKPTLGTHIHTTWPSIAEVVGYTGLFDYVEFVAEYGPFDLYALDDFCRAVELHDMAAMIKVDQEPRKFLAQRAIGSGFQSVLFADCRSAADVEECIRAVRPDTPEDGGCFGAAMRRFSYMGYGGSAEYVQALRDIVVAIMIEKKTAVEQLEDILALDGIDMVQWGPTDYSMSSGKAGFKGDPVVKSAEKYVFETCLRMGVPPRAEIDNADDAKYYLDMGVKHFCIGTDVRILFGWLREHGDRLKRALEGE
ncbi:MAG: 2,4-dihydroxyhept-2-ene-1,7-dioic acid aldolase [Chloroflexi bacterium]|nr:2,4-dihydroxyhept-2-ene-1,7-dioic acid aldolase [Chloroflexota bacterium]